MECRRDPRVDERTVRTCVPGSLRGHRVLVVNDNRDAADSLVILLQLAGAQVHCEHGGPAALESIRTHRPAVAFIDLGMPGMDGYAVAAQVRREPELKGTTLIALTDWGQQEDRRRSQQAGFDHHLTKPATLQAIEQLLALAVQGRPF